MKQIIFDQQAREALQRGVDKLANTVGATLGPMGRNVILGRSFGQAHMTKDGVTVAKDIMLSDPVENIGANLVRQVASKTDNIAGDGTTTATVLAQAIFNSGLQAIIGGRNPMDLKRGIDKAVAAVVDYLNENKIDIKDGFEEIRNIAIISANNDEEIGQIVADAMEKVGKAGVLTVEEGKGLETTIDVVEGMQFSRGYLSPYFITQPEDQSAVYENAFIMVTDKRISNWNDLVPIMEKIGQTGEPLVIIAEDVQDTALQGLVINKMQAGLRVIAVKGPGYGDRRKEMLEDLATVVGATVISEDKGFKLNDIDLSFLGRAGKVTCTRDTTTITAGAGDPEDIKARIQSLIAQEENLKETFLKKQMQDRITSLSGGVGVISVGAASELEMKEKKDRVDDAVRATRAAIEEGILPGGGTAFVKCADYVLGKLEGLNEDEEAGARLVLSAITAPIKLIASNAGVSADLVYQTVKAKKDKNWGYNAKTGEYGNLLKMGVIDPKKVSRIAIEQAGSIAGMLITTQAIVAPEPDADKPPIINQGGLM